VLSFPPSVRIFVARDPVDLRKSFDTLAALVPALWATDPLSGHVFCFFNRRADRVKLLVWDRTGFWLFYKRLEAGRFRVPKFDHDALAAKIDATSLAMLLDGIDLTRVRRGKKWIPPAGDRQEPQNLISTPRWPSPSTGANGASAARRSKAPSSRSRAMSRSSSTSSRR
jgi:transposase